MEKTRFEKFIPIIFRNEGFDSVTNDKHDSGGITKWGISDLRDGKRDGMVDSDGDGIPDVKVEHLTLEQAEIIYKSDYYDKCRIDSIRSEMLALHVFDMAVNSGTYRAIKMLQRVCMAKEDGIIGKKTLALCNTLPCVSKYISARENFYKYIGKGKNERYLNGWMNRVKNTTNSL